MCRRVRLIASRLLRSAIRRSHFCLPTLVVLQACARLYSSVYIDAVDPKTKTSVPADVYSAVDGHYVGLAPVKIDLDHHRGEPIPCILPILISRSAGSGLFQIMIVDRWYHDRAEADIRANNYRIAVPPNGSPGIFVPPSTATDSSQVVDTRHAFGVCW